MSKARKKQIPASEAPASEFPSASALASLMDLMKQDSPKSELARTAWPIVVKAAMNSDFVVVADYALENGLIKALADTPAARRDPSDAASFVWVNPVDGLHMVWIPPGEFYVGGKQELATLGGFSLARFPVTNAQFLKFVRSVSYAPEAAHVNGESYLLHWTNREPPKSLELHPVTQVSYIDALNYCRWANLTLPTEWMWEKAARGPDGRRYPWGDDSPVRKTKPLAHIMKPGTCAIGKFSSVRSPYGCEDMIGNVSEWCQSGEGVAWDFMPPTIPEVPDIVASADVLGYVRGSCFFRSDPGRMTAFHRRRLSLARCNQWCGFRPALPLPYRPAIDE